MSRFRIYSVILPYNRIKNLCAISFHYILESIRYSNSIEVVNYTILKKICKYYHQYLLSWESVIKLWEYYYILPKTNCIGL
ncbi:hypothetical protein V1477_002719 [Vespula maculifrons]|uniref:Uncharacterized protein n=1 Tax=Vespula maculifrons TaxID=7453 RepID=A0ABD2CVE1_VESMC